MDSCIIKKINDIHGWEIALGLGVLSCLSVLLTIICLLVAFRGTDWDCGLSEHYKEAVPAWRNITLSGEV